MRSRIMYQPGSSILHRLHPLVKVAWMLFGTVFVFATHNPWAVLGVLILVLASFPLNNLSLRQVHGTRLFASTALLLGSLQVVFVRQGATLAQVGPLHVTSGGIEAGVYIAARFLSVVLMSYLFVLTTDPNSLAYTLMQAGLPYRYGFALITALRLMPVFEQEGQIIYEAQLARGVRYDTRSPRRLLALMRQFFMPMLISALGKVDALAVSMEGRCFGKYPTRTFLREIQPTRRDIVLSRAAVLLLVASVGGSIALLVFT